MSAKYAQAALRLVTLLDRVANFSYFANDEHFVVAKDGNNWSVRAYRELLVHDHYETKKFVDFTFTDFDKVIDFLITNCPISV